MKRSLFTIEKWILLKWYICLLTHRNWYSIYYYQKWCNELRYLDFEKLQWIFRHVGYFQNKTIILQVLYQNKCFTTRRRISYRYLIVIRLNRNISNVVYILIIESIEKKYNSFNFEWIFLEKCENLLWFCDANITKEITLSLISSKW